MIKIRVTLFSKAIRLQQFLKETGRTHNKLHFRFEFEKEPEKDITTWIEIDNGKTVMSCTCVHGSVHYEALCSHKLAVIFYLFKQQMRKLKEKW